MSCRLFSPRVFVWTYSLGSLLLFSTTNVLAQDVGFADDFSTNSLRYSSDGFNNSPADSSATGVDGGILFAIDNSNSNGESDDQTHRNMILAGASDRAFITGRVDASLLRLGGPDSFADLELRGTPFNDTIDGGIEEEDNFNVIGDVFLNVFLFTQPERTGAAACIGRQGPDNEYQPINVFANGNCIDFNEVPVVPDTEYTLGYELNRGTGELIFSINNAERSVMLDTEFFEAGRGQVDVQLRQNSDGATNFLLTQYETDTEQVDFADTTPVVDRYRSNDNSDPNRQVTYQADPGRVKATAISSTGDYEAGSLEPNELTDYYEALVTVSSESILTEGAIIDGRIEAVLLSTSDSSEDDNDRRGHIRTQIEFGMEASGARYARYCAQRSDDSDFDARTGLLEDGRNCLDFPLLVNFDQAYRLSMSVDKESKTYTFRIDGHEAVVVINEDVFEPNARYADARISGNRGGTAIGYIDNFRTQPNLPTANEIAAGSTAPPVFPDPVDPESLIVDSTLDNTFDTTRPSDFVDDFSEDTSRYSYAFGNNRGDVSAFYQDGALELQVNTANSDSSNWSEFSVNDDSDSFKARVSMSSESRLPPGGQSNAEVGIQAVMHNDSQDNGFNREEGDIRITLRLQLQANGGRRVGASLRRRDENGQENGDNLAVFSGDNFFTFNNFVPELDTIYELGISIDRGAGTVTLSVDDMSETVQLPTQAFQAYRPIKIVGANYSGTSGRAVGRVHSISTEDFSQDFSTEVPLVGPYRQRNENYYPGVEVEIVDDRLMLSVDGRVAGSEVARIQAHNLSDYIAADIELSSESVVATEGFARVQVGGLMYNDLADSGINNSEGDVFALINIDQLGSGDISAYYCVFRANNGDFSDATELLSGLVNPNQDNSDCPRFNVTPALDTTYSASVSIDREMAQLNFSFAGESVVYDIGTDVFDAFGSFNGAQVRTSSDSMVIGYIDNLSYAADAVPLAMSDSRLSIDQTQIIVDGSDTGDSVADGAEDDNGAAVPGAQDPVTGSSSGSSGGCSIATGGSNPTLIWLVFAALGGLTFRRRKMK